MSTKKDDVALQNTKDLLVQLVKKLLVTGRKEGEGQFLALDALRNLDFSKYAGYYNINPKKTMQETTEEFERLKGALRKSSPFSTLIGIYGDNHLDEKDPYSRTIHNTLVELLQVIASPPLDQYQEDFRAIVFNEVKNFLDNEIGKKKKESEKQGVRERLKALEKDEQARLSGGGQPQRLAKSILDSYRQEVGVLEKALSNLSKEAIEFKKTLDDGSAWDKNATEKEISDKEQEMQRLRDEIQDLYKKIKDELAHPTAAVSQRPSVSAASKPAAAASGSVAAMSASAAVASTPAVGAAQPVKSTQSVKSAQEIAFEKFEEELETWFAQGTFLDTLDRILEAAIKKEEVDHLRAKMDFLNDATSREGMPFDDFSKRDAAYENDGIKELYYFLNDLYYGVENPRSMYLRQIFSNNIYYIPHTQDPSSIQDIRKVVRPTVESWRKLLKKQLDIAERNAAQQQAAAAQGMFGATKSGVTKSGATTPSSISRPSTPSSVTSGTTVSGSIASGTATPGSTPGSTPGAPAPGTPMAPSSAPATPVAPAPAPAAPAAAPVAAPVAAAPAAGAPAAAAPAAAAPATPAPVVRTPIPSAEEQLKKKLSAAAAVGNLRECSRLNRELKSLLSAAAAAPPAPVVAVSRPAPPAAAAAVATPASAAPAAGAPILLLQEQLRKQLAAAAAAGNLRECSRLKKEIQKLSKT